MNNDSFADSFPRVQSFILHLSWVILPNLSLRSLRLCGE